MVRGEVDILVLEDSVIVIQVGEQVLGTQNPHLQLDALRRLLHAG